MRLRDTKKRPREGEFTLPRDNHELFGVTTLSGAAVGATAGMIAGPPGMVVGGVIGTAVGVLAGNALEKDARATAQHDEEIDDIGGDLESYGTPPEGLNPLQEVEREEFEQRQKRELELTAVIEAPPSWAKPDK
ncbi:hypothetical protein [Labilithrix luteola]|nr:hypothetical protein [Labilithrix luteola]